jgi:sporulation protein YlmC with PRC-barrel domain
MGLPVFTEEARPIGAICDFVFDGSTGEISSIEVSRGMIGDLASGSISVTADGIVRMSATGAQVVIPEALSEGAGTRLGRVVGREAGKAFVRAKHAAKRAARKLEKRDE